MRAPRIRFTIGGLMVLVLVSGLALWSMRVARRIQTPTLSELQAQAAYKQAMLVREVAEYAVKEYMEGDYLQARMGSWGLGAQAKADGERAIARLQLQAAIQRFDEGRLTFITKTAFLSPTSTALASDPEKNNAQLAARMAYIWEKQTRSLMSDVAKARADEQAKLATYQRERARRMHIFGF